MDELSTILDGLTFFRQKRADGGLRTGIMLGESTVLGRFEGGEEDYNPTLLWSIDLRCRGASLPSTTEEARRWLLDHEEIIREGFARFAEELGAGIDPTGAYLLEWKAFPKPVNGVDMRIVCGALRRYDARSLPGELKDVGANLVEYVGSLGPIQAAVS